MNIFAIVCAGLAFAAAAIPAVAQPIDPGIRPSVQVPAPAPAPQREADRPAPQRDMRGPAEADRGRMNPDERRQLRRDIQNAGRDIYRPARNAPAPGHSGRSGRR